MIFLQLFWTFFKIGLFGFGGGYAMISLIQGEVVQDHHWISSGQFTDIVAVSQSTPGPIGINSATYVGYSSVVNAGYTPAVGFLGSLISTIAVVLPSFILMLLISKFLMRYKNHSSVEHTFQGLRPAVVGLLLAAALMLMTGENFSTPNECLWQFIVSLLLFAFAVIAQGIFKLGAIRIILISALVGIALL